MELSKINQKNKKLEEQKKRGREYFKYLDELEILKREKVNTPKREEELIKKIEEREEAGKRYAEYKRNLKKWIKHMKKYLKNKKAIGETDNSKKRAVSFASFADIRISA